MYPARNLASLLLVVLPTLFVVHARAAPGGKPNTNDARALAIAANGSQTSTRGPAENFTGSVRVDPLFQANGDSSVGGAYVTFEPGARSAWHTHPRGQRLVVTAGTGRVQRAGGPVQEIRPGDVVWIPPGEKHWHGASPTTGMTHLAVQEQVDGKSVAWMEKVSDAEYDPRP